MAKEYKNKVKAKVASQTINEPSIKTTSVNDGSTTETTVESTFEKRIEEAAATVEKKGTEVATEVKSKFASSFSIMKWSWAFILIIGGLLLLLNNFIKIPSSAFVEILGMFFKLWPLLLILAGIQIIFDKNKFSKIVVTILVFLLLSLVVTIGLFNSGIKMFKWVGDVVPAVLIDLSKSDYETENYSHKSSKLDEDVTRLELDYNFAVSSFNISDATSEELSDRFTVIEGKNFKSLGLPSVKEDLNGSVQKFEFDNRNRKFETFFHNREGEKYDVQFVPAGRTSLNVEVSAAQGTINLDEGIYRNLNYSVNVGELKAKLSPNVEVDYAKFDVNVGDLVFNTAESDIRNINAVVNVGSALLLVDLDEYTVNVNYNVSVGSLSMFGKSFTGRGEETFGNGDKQLLVRVRVDVGDFEIRDSK